MKTNIKTIRFYAVQGGHVHAEGCGHIHQWRLGASRTKATHIESLDGKTDKQIVAEFGPIACSHCIGGASTAKITKETMDNLTGKTARREKAAAERARIKSLQNDPELVAARAAFRAADDAQDYEAAAPLYRKMIEIERALGIR